MEMLVVVGFFIICASICVLVFVKATTSAKDARDINQAVLKAQSLAEELKAGRLCGGQRAAGPKHMGNTWQRR